MFVKIGTRWVNPALIAHLELVEHATVPRLTVTTADGGQHTEKGPQAGEVFRALMSRSVAFVQRDVPAMPATNGATFTIQTPPPEPPAAAAAPAPKPKRPRR